MKSTEYFRYRRKQADRSWIREEWIERVIQRPVRRIAQTDGRIRYGRPFPKRTACTYVLYCSLTVKPFTMPSLTEIFAYEN